MTDWHAARADVWARALLDELPDDGVGAFLAWGDPSLYDSTLRILELVARRIDLRFDVVPGITAIQALTARHRIPLNDVGEPVLITTGPQAPRRGTVRRRGGDARRRLRIPRLPARHQDLVGRLPRYAGRAPRRRAPSATWASGSLRSGPRRGTATAGSWTRICCGPAASVLARKVPVERPLAVGGAVQGSSPWGDSSFAQA